MNLDRSMYIWQAPVFPTQVALDQLLQPKALFPSLFDIDLVQLPDSPLALGCVEIVT
jgi:hypothetical protein